VKPKNGFFDQTGYGRTPLEGKGFLEKVAPGVPTPQAPFSKDAKLLPVFRSSSMKVSKNQPPRNDSLDRPYMPFRGLIAHPNRTLYDPKEDEEKQMQIQNARVPKDISGDPTQDAHTSMLANNVVDDAPPPSKPGPKRDYTTFTIPSIGSINL